MPGVLDYLPPAGSIETIRGYFGFWGLSCGGLVVVE
jgi:hypothetical protein